VVPLPLGSLPAALPALTDLQMACEEENFAAVDVSGLAGLRRLAVYAPGRVEGLSELTALEDLHLNGDNLPMAQPSDLAPLTALTRLAMWCVPPELGSLPVAARLRRLELQAFGVLDWAPGGGDGSGANGAAAAALALLARGAPLLEQMRIHVSSGGDDETWLLQGHPDDVELGAPLGPGVAWPSLTHFEATPWAALLLAACAFPRLSRLVANITEAGDDFGIASNEQLRTAVTTLAAKARDHAALVIRDRRGAADDAASLLAAAATVPNLRHLSWECSWPCHHGSPAASPGDWARLAASLESLELAGDLAGFGYAEPLAALTGLTQLLLTVTSNNVASSALALTSRALARLPRLAHLRLTFSRRGLSAECPEWACPAVAAELARCPALRLLEIDRRDGTLWRHEPGPIPGSGPRMPRPSPAWPPFAQALRAGGFGAAVRPAPEGLGGRLWIDRLWVELERQ
jgi:hypothetical protein